MRLSHFSIFYYQSSCLPPRRMMAFVLALAEQDSQLDDAPQKKSQPVKRILHSCIVCIKSYAQVIHFIRKNWWIAPFRKLAENGIMWWGEVGESGEFQSLDGGE